MSTFQEINQHLHGHRHPGGLILPSKHFSYSAASLWYSSKPAFRSRYYKKIQTPTNLQMEYGSEIADLLEKQPDHPTVAHIPKYNIRDQGFTVDIDGVTLLMYPDTLSLQNFPVKPPKFAEYKTGEWVENNPAWTQKKADEHIQLKLYSLGLKLKYHAVDDLCHLYWLVTNMVEHTDPITIFGKQYEATIELPRLTQTIIPFEVNVTEIERFKARQWFVQAVHEVANDYKNYLKTV